MDNSTENEEVVTDNFVVTDEFNKELLENSNVKNLAMRLMRKAVARGFDITNDDAVDEVYEAILAVNERRRFVSSKEQLYETKYDGLILRLAISAISKYGAEGQTSHVENGIHRNYEAGSAYPTSMLQEIVPLAKGVDE